MREFITKYGMLKGIISSEFYENGMLKECSVNSCCRLETPYGILVPQYEDKGLRRKHIISVSFYASGALKTISLNEQVKLSTSVGIVPAEFVTFYEGGNIKRIFPLNGKISAYWNEEEEFGLTEELSFDFPFGSFTSRIIGIYFYEDGQVKSLTFWPGSSVEILTPAGNVKVRTGLSLYQSGKIKSFEPEFPTDIQTPIGTISAFSTSVLGINGDINSVCFHENGELMFLTTSTDYITVKNEGKIIKTFGPSLVASQMDASKKDICPLKLEFSNGQVIFEDNPLSSFDISTYSFEIQSFPELLNLTCGDCSDCSGCGASKYEF